MNSEKGNALFLILIAVALFAALSYAVTNSGRGGSGIDREQAEIMAAQILQSAAAVQSHIQRLKIIGSYDGVTFDESAENASGTCYIGSSTSTCTTVGLFGTDSGLPMIFWDDKVRQSSYTGDYRWELTSVGVEINGSDAGTPAPDLLLQMIALEDEICKAINRRMNNVSSIGALTFPTGNGHGYSSASIRDGGVYGATGTSASDIVYAMPYEGCVTNGGYNYFEYILETY